MLNRVLIAVDQQVLRRKLRSDLGGDGDALVETIRIGPHLWERLGRQTCDLVVLSESLVPAPRRETLAVFGRLPEAPAVALLMEEDDPAAQAAYLSAGCAVALWQELPGRELGEVLRTLLRKRRRLLVEELDRRPMLDLPRLHDFVSHSEAMRSFMSVVHRLVRSDVSLLILGETGVGKERLARAIHAEGRRSAAPFVAINCGSLPETLLESELFGHEEGAFTGATRARRGAFEVAHGGTLFLDEIGEMPLHLQVKLLRILQEKEIRRVGGEKPFPVDVRIMAATNREIEAEVEARRFRQDLYYRLSVVTLTIPPLRERTEDIAELAQGYVDYLRPRIGCEIVGIEPAAMAALERYDWPGNVRELINVVERAMLLCEGEAIRLEDLPQAVGECVSFASRSRVDGRKPEIAFDGLYRLPLKAGRRRLVETFEREYLDHLLSETEGKIGEAARRAGMDPRSLYAKMRSLGLRKEAYKE